MQINNIYHITYYYKQSTKLLEIHKLSKQYLLHRICVLSLSVMTVLANAWHTKLLLNALQCSCWLKMMTTLSLSCWQEWHNYCHSWNIDCVITDWLIYLLRLRTSSLHRLAHLIQEYNTLADSILPITNVIWHTNTYRSIRLK